MNVTEVILRERMMNNEEANNEDNTVVICIIEIEANRRRFFNYLFKA